MLNGSCVGQALTPYSVAVESGRLCLFAKATGQTDRVNFEEAAACEGGYRSGPVPPTIQFCLENESPDPQELLRLVGLDLGRLPHGEQSFVHHRTACDGEVLTLQRSQAVSRTLNVLCTATVVQNKCCDFWNTRTASHGN